MQNELAVMELIHCFVEVLDKHFGQVCELDIMNDPDVVSCKQQTRKALMLGGCCCLVRCHWWCDAEPAPPMA